MVTVLATDWSVSTHQSSSAAGVVLHVHRGIDAPNAFGGRGLSVFHPVAHGLTFPTSDHARAFALSVGLLKLYVRAGE